MTHKVGDAEFGKLDLKARVQASQACQNFLCWRRCEGTDKTKSESPCMDHAEIASLAYRGSDKAADFRQSHEKLSARISETCSGPVPFEEGDANTILDLPDLAADRRLAHAKLSCCGAETAALCDRQHGLGHGRQQSRGDIVPSESLHDGGCGDLPIFASMNGFTHSASSLQQFRIRRPNASLLGASGFARRVIFARV